MNIYRYFVYKKNRIPAAVLLALLALTGCRSNNNSTADPSASGSDFYASRPKIILETPIARLPYTLRWEGSNAVRSYEIQSALNPEFTQSRQNWTTKESSLVITELKGDTVYFRVRSHFDTDYSRWSEVLVITGSPEEIMLNRLRN